MDLPPNGDDEGACYADGMAEKPIVEVAKELAEAHRREDPDTKEIFLAPHPAEVRLVEVTGSLGSSGEVLPFRFAPSPENDVPYPSVVVLLSTDDWARVQRGDLKLPPDWGTAAALQKIA